MRGTGHRNGRLDLKVRGLSRAGMVLASNSIDLAVAAMIDDRQAGARVVAASGGKVIGRAQARFAPMGNGPLTAELMNAPLFAQLRYSGPADTLWRLTGSEILDLSGPFALAADIGGTLADPVTRGLVRTQNGAARKPGHRHGHRPARNRGAILRDRNWCSARSAGGAAPADRSAAAARSLSPAAKL